MIFIRSKNRAFKAGLETVKQQTVSKSQSKGLFSSTWYNVFIYKYYLGGL